MAEDNRAGCLEPVSILVMIIIIAIAAHKALNRIESLERRVGQLEQLVEMLKPKDQK